MAEPNNQPNKAPPMAADQARIVTPEEQHRREEARREALANWEGEGGHLVSNSAKDGKKSGA